MDELYCGAAREKITPPMEWLPNLRGLMNQEFSSVVDDLYVRVVALRSETTTLLLVSFDVDKAPAPEESLAMLEEETGVQQDHILFTAIHAHSAPITGERPFEGPNALARKPLPVQEMTRRYEKFLQERTVLAAKEALGLMEPAVMGYGFGESYVNVSRIAFYETVDADGTVKTVVGTGTDYQKEIDHTLFVMRLSSRSGAPLAFLINYPVHNTVMIRNACGAGGKVGISPDLGGTVSRQMEELNEGAVCVWTSGAAGDINPIMSNQVYREDMVSGRPIEVYEDRGETALSMLKTLTAHHLADIRRVERRIEPCTYQGPALLTAAADWAVVEGRDDRNQPIPYRVRVHRLTIGPVIFFAFSGELYSGLGKRLKERLVSWMEDVSQEQTFSEMDGMPEEQAVSRMENVSKEGPAGMTEMPDSQMKKKTGQEILLINHDASLLCNAGYIFGDEIFRIQEQYEGDIVGMRHTWLRPGFIEDALLESMKKLTGLPVI